MAELPTVRMLFLLGLSDADQLRPCVCNATWVHHRTLSCADFGKMYGIPLQAGSGTAETLLKEDVVC